MINYSFVNGSIGYDEASREVDRRTRLHNWLFTISAGNVVAPTPPLGDFVRAPATAKNAIAVGATENFTNIVGTGGSWPKMGGLLADTCNWGGYSPAGPPDGNYTPEDARNIPTYSPRRQDPTTFVLKPDLVSVGSRVTAPLSRNYSCPTTGTIFCNSNIDQFLTGTGLDFSYGFSVGTSFSAPAVAGAAAVVRKWYTNNWWMNASAAMTKAMLINGARDIAGGLIRNQSFSTVGWVSHITHDPYQGWGSLNLDRLLGSGANYYAMDQGVVLDMGNTFWETALTVRDESRPIRITMVYTDSPGQIGTSYSVRNDLTLGAYQVACFPCWFGNNLDQNSGYSIANSRSRDGVNNVEEIIIPPYYYSTGATVRVFVNADNLVADGLNPDNLGYPFRQDFALFVDNLY